MSKPLKLHLISLGCNKNLVDSEVMLYKLRDYLLTQKIEEADLIIINTCGFINSAKEESIRTILNANELRKKNSTLLVAGCLSERYKKDLFKSLKEVDIFIGLGDYDKILDVLKQKQNRFSDSIFLIDKEKRKITGSNSHAYIKLSEGCNQRCSFCAIPTFRGKLKSRSIRSCVDEVKRLVLQGYYDFSFISQDSSSYLYDQKDKQGLIKLIKEVEKISGVKKARILYLYPSSISKDLIDTIFASNVFENYFDIPLQHISDKMLKVMRRGRGEKATKEIINYIRSKGEAWLRTAFIVGHPGESDDDFKNLLEYIDQNLFDMVGVFEYSREENTPAFDMEQIDRKTIQKRMKKIQKAIEKNQKRAFEAFLGKTLQASIAHSEDEFFINAKNLSWSPEIDPEILINDSEVGNLKVGDLVNVTITKVLENQFLGKVVL